MHRHYDRPTFNILIILSVMLSFAKFSNAEQKIPQTPCRSVFNYKVRNGTNEVFGYLKFANDYSGDYQLEVHMSVATRIHENIAVLRLPNEDQIQCGADLEYEVTFPSCNGLIPWLTFVKYNNKIYCTGPPQRDVNGWGSSNLSQFDGLVTDMHENTCEMSTSKNDTPIHQPTTTTEKQVLHTKAPDGIVRVKQEGCGIIQEINGKEHYPWLATIYYKGKNDNSTNKYHCSGALISKSHVLTVPHCLVVPDPLDKSLITIRMGRNNIKAIKPSESTTIRSVKNIIIHPMYESRHQKSNNIAIIELDQPVEYSDLIRPACLWKDDDDLGEVVSEKAIVIGWDSDAKPKKFTMPIVSLETCLLSHESFTKLVGPNSFCAGTRDGVAPCVGNSGGSLLLLRGDGRYYLRGLTAFAIAARNLQCDKYHYNIFTDVAKFKSWITFNINS